jgi:hypothetical protein
MGADGTLIPPLRQAPPVGCKRRSTADKKLKFENNEKKYFYNLDICDNFLSWIRIQNNYDKN